MIQRIGFACKPSRLNSRNQIESIPEYNTKTTTIAWLNRQIPAVAEQKLWDLMVYNINTVTQAASFVGKLPLELRFFRISSDVLPAYTESKWKSFWQRSDVQTYAEKNFKKIGDIATHSNVRLSFHPGQFCCLASTSQDVVDRSIAELEYHADMVRWMGYGNRFQDFTINVHVSGKNGPSGVRRVFDQLSTELQNTITFENDEFACGLDECLTLADKCPIVLDVHHHYINSGEYIEASDPRILKVVDSWRGCRPKLHYSISREELVQPVVFSEKPSLAVLLEQGFKRAKLRAHSDYCWHAASNDWVLSHWPWADIMVEAKAKNLASFGLYDYWKTHHG